MVEQSEKRWLKAIPIDIKGLYQRIDEPLPHSVKHWWWCWGGIVGLLFLLQVVCGLLLAFYYRAEPGVSYETITYISKHARFGLFMRSVHHWGASFMIIFLFLHMLRVFVTGSFREYRWGAWMIGVGLLGTTFGLAFTGYSLVSDQLSYWGVTVTSNIMAIIPVIGPVLKNYFLAGDSYNPATLSRMYALHVQILPAVLVLLGIGHLFFVRLFGLYKPGNEQDLVEEDELTNAEGPYNFYPNHLISEIAIGLYIFLVIFLLAIAFPAPLGPQADPLITPAHIKPEWYFYPFFHLLKLVPGAIGVAIISLIGLCLFLWPIIDQYIFQGINKKFKNRIEIGVILGLVVICFYLVWAVAEAG